MIIMSALTDLPSALRALQITKIGNHIVIKRIYQNHLTNPATSPTVVGVPDTLVS